MIGTTVHIQDLKDQEGDRARNRRTAPLVLGDGPAQWTIAIPTAIWSVACPIFWQLDFLGYALPVGVGIIIVIRVLLVRGFVRSRQAHVVVVDSVDGDHMDDPLAQRLQRFCSVSTRYESVDSTQHKRSESSYQGKHKIEIFYTRPRRACV